MIPRVRTGKDDDDMDFQIPKSLSSRLPPHPLLRTRATMHHPVSYIFCPLAFEIVPTKMILVGGLMAPSCDNRLHLKVGIETKTTGRFCRASVCGCLWESIDHVINIMWGFACKRMLMLWDSDNKFQRGPECQ